MIVPYGTFHCGFHNFETDRPVYNIGEHIFNTG